VLTTSYPRSPADSAGRFVADSVERLRAAGVEIEVVSPMSFRHFGIAYGHGVVGNLRRRPLLVLLLPAMLASFTRAARQAARDADLVHAHWLPAGLVASLSGRPFVVQLWGTDVELARRAPRAARLVLRRARLAICASQELARAAEAKTELEALDEGADPVAAAEQAVERAEARVRSIAGELHDARAAAAGGFAESVAGELQGMGMGDGEFTVELKERDPGATGTDEAVFLIRPNAGLPFGPVAETASGGELSRVALAIAAVGGGETMVFDEIDAGIGGQTGHGVADTLARLAVRAQVVTITHLPQIASRADRHFRVEKIPGDPTHTRIQELSDMQRKEEIERMLGGREFLSTLDQ